MSHTSFLAETDRVAVLQRLRQHLKTTDLGRITAQLESVEAELLSLGQQLIKLKGPDGDRVLAKMVQTRLDEGKRAALSLLRKATACQEHGVAGAALRLVIAERAEKYDAPAREAAWTLRRQALDGLLKLAA